MVCLPGIARDLRAFAYATVVVLMTAVAAPQVLAFSGTRSNRTAPETHVAAHASVSVATPARFFTIRAVLADLDSRRSDGLAAPRATQVALQADLPPTDNPPNPSPGFIRGREPFGLSIFRAPDGVLWRKWRGVEGGLLAEQGALDECRRDETRCSPGARRFLRIVEAVRSRHGHARFETANRTINVAVRYTSDIAQHDEPDRWSTPVSTLSTGRGDCEDYAIAKYAVLKETGVADDDLRLVLVRDRRAGEDHAVLAVRSGERWMILDNRYDSVVPDAEIRHFTPLYAINRDGVALFAAPYLTGSPPSSPASAPMQLDHAPGAASVPVVDTLAIGTTGLSSSSASFVEHPTVF
jgi:predicted transglutaminase-like cysteine proteinase